MKATKRIQLIKDEMDCVWQSSHYTAKEKAVIQLRATKEIERLKKGVTKCAICEEHIDRGACGQEFAIITIKDDSANKQEEYKQTRMYLCDNCTPKLRVFLANEAMKYFER